MSNIADLILQKGQIQANARLGSAQAKAGAVQGVAGAIAGSIADLPRLRQQELQEKAARLNLGTAELNYDELKDSQTRKKKADAIMSQYTDVESGKVDYQKTLRELRANNLLDYAGQVQDQWIKERKNTADEIKQTLEDFNTRLDKSRTLLYGIHDQASLDRVRPYLELELGKEYSSMIPTTYDPEAFKSLSTLGEAADQYAKRQTFAMDMAKKALDNASEEFKANEDWKTSWSSWVSTVNSQEQYDAAMNSYAQNGAPLDIVMQFGTRWSPDVKKRATDAALGAKERENNKVTLSGQGVASREATDRARDAAAQAALVWKQNQLAKAREQLRNDPVDAWGTVVGKRLTQEQYDAEVKAIETSYQEMLKGAGVTGAGAAAPAPAAQYKYVQTRVIDGREVQAGSNDGVHWTRIK